MMVLTDVVSSIFRLAELVFAAIAAGITGHYLALASSDQSSWELGRFIYTEVVAGLSIFLSIVWMFPFASSFIHWPTDFVLSIAWFISFGLMVDWLADSCGQTFDWSALGFRGTNCETWKTDEAFAFLSAICWFVSALLGLHWVHEHMTRTVPTATSTTKRRWYRSSRV